MRNYRKGTENPKKSLIFVFGTVELLGDMLGSAIGATSNFRPQNLSIDWHSTADARLLVLTLAKCFGRCAVFMGSNAHLALAIFSREKQKVIRVRSSVSFGGKCDFANGRHRGAAWLWALPMPSHWGPFGTERASLAPHPRAYERGTLVGFTSWHIGQ